MRIVQGTHLKYHILNEDGYKKIVIGEFSKSDEAAKAKNKLKCLPKDSFVRLYQKKEKRKNIALDDKSATDKKTLTCNIYTDHSKYRACEISKALEYLRTSGYYHFTN
jgi:hypothetical protein